MKYGQLKQKIAVFLLAFLLLGGVKPGYAATYEYDLGVATGDIFFSKEQLIAGESIRIYASVHNYGQKDVQASVVFYAGSVPIGEPQPVSLRANGPVDEVFVDWVVPENNFNIRVEIKDATPRDDDSSNNIAITALFAPKNIKVIPLNIKNAEPLKKNNKLAVETKKNNPVVNTNMREVNLRSKVKNKNINANIQETITPDEVIKIEQEQIKSGAGLIDVAQKGWDTFIFRAETSKVKTQNPSYDWNFGDGTIAKELITEHTFKPGKYTIHLDISDGPTKIAEEDYNIVVSFWNIGNSQVQWSLGGLGIVLMGLVYGLRKITLE